MMPEVPQSSSVTCDFLPRERSPRQQLPAADHPACSRRVPASSACTACSAALLGPQSYKELPRLLARGPPGFGSKLQLFQLWIMPCSAALQLGGEGPVGEAQHIRSANTAGTMLAAETQLHGRTCPAPEVRPCAAGSTPASSCRKTVSGAGRSKGPCAPAGDSTLLGCAEPAPLLGAGDARWIELCIKRAQGNLSLCEGENVILYLVLLCIFFCKHKTVVGSKNCFSVNVTGSQRRWNSTEGTNKVSWAHLQSQAGFCLVLTSPRCQTRISLSRSAIRAGFKPGALRGHRPCISKCQLVQHLPGDAEGCPGEVEAGWAQTCSQLCSSPVARALHPVAWLRIPGTPL